MQENNLLWHVMVLVEVVHVIFLLGLEVSALWKIILVLLWSGTKRFNLLPAAWAAIAAQEYKGALLDLTKYIYTRLCSKVHIGVEKAILSTVKTAFWERIYQKCTLVDICTCCIMSSFKCLHLIKSLLLCCSREVKKLACKLSTQRSLLLYFLVSLMLLGVSQRKKTYLHECLLIKSSGADKIHLPKASVLKRRLSSCIAVVLLKDCFLLHSAASH